MTGGGLIPTRGRAAVRAVRCLGLAFLLLGTSPSVAANEAVPPALQVALFSKIFPYNKSLPPSFKILIVYTGEFAASAEEVRKGFDKAARTVELCPMAEYLRRSSKASVVYVMANAVPPAMQALCIREHIFSVSPLAALAERGEVSVAVGLKQDGKSEIIVHLNRSKMEGQELLMPLLSLARVIR
jgi:hypothetical protein